jgi:hypothetical protein
MDIKPLDEKPLDPKIKERADAIAAARETIAPYKEAETFAVRKDPNNDIIIAYRDNLDGFEKPKNVGTSRSELWEPDALAKFDNVFAVLEDFRAWRENYGFPAQPPETTPEQVTP